MNKPVRAIEGKCLHYNGTLKNDACDAGVNYNELKGDATGPLLYVLPCFGRAMKCEKPCAKRSLPTLEQVNAWKQYTQQRLACTLEAISKIQEQNKLDKAGFGTITCPSCKGNLQYSISSYNGHVHGQCKTEGCLQWMQ